MEIFHTGDSCNLFFTFLVLFQFGIRPERVNAGEIRGILCILNQVSRATILAASRGPGDWPSCGKGKSPDNSSSFSRPMLLPGLPNHLVQMEMDFHRSDRTLQSHQRIRCSNRSRQLNQWNDGLRAGWQWWTCVREACDGDLL